ncbi:hypothetical protein F4556_006834 [Kitasatospora gansuensis]|uniref:Uncharacterized protein n=1 Tax=Kitasatospora gansuensis TaxID=258050 RepID=A0A7W7WM09_9ACTN|nr:hypothetical protein [Kitasatospora gansuensis]
MRWGRKAGPGAWPDALVSRTAIRPIRGCRGTGASRSRPTYRPACTATANFDGSGTVTPSESGMTSAGIVCRLTPAPTSARITRSSARSGSSAAWPAGRTVRPDGGRRASSPVLFGSVGTA